jgi:hypothetical protein
MKLTNNTIISTIFFLTLIPSLGFGPMNISLIGGILLIIFCFFENKCAKDFLIKYSIYFIFISFLIIYSILREVLSIRQSNITNSTPEIEILLKYIYMIVIPLIVFSFKKFSNKINFERVFFLFSFISLIFYILKVIGITITDVLPISSIGLRDYGRFVIKNIYIEYLHRNTFLSGEPSFLTGTLAAMFFLTKNRSTKFLILINLALSISRLGFVIFIVCALFNIFLYILEKRKKNASKAFFLMYVFFIVFISVVYVLVNLLNQSFNDLSSLARYNAIITSLKMFKDNIIFGVGIGRYPYEYFKYEFISNLGQYKIPNPGSLYTLAFSEGGIIFGFLFLLFIIYIYNKLTTRKLRVAFVSILIFWLNTAHIQLIWQWSFIGILLGLQNDYIQKQFKE